MHLTLRARQEVASLRAPRVFQAVRESIRCASREAFRILHFSVQRDHVHLIVEAQDTRTLSTGAQGLAVRMARGVNGALGRTGSVWGDRYHARDLTSPRETRHALVYVLMNLKKHHPHDRRPIDPCSSAPWFDGFRTSQPLSSSPPPVWRPGTWLARTGWRQHGLIDPNESPKPS